MSIDRKARKPTPKQKRSNFKKLKSGFSSNSLLFDSDDSPIEPTPVAPLLSDYTWGQAAMRVDSDLKAEKICDPLEFYKSYGDSEEAKQRLDG